jgi:two-component system cell cycle sensor histidine kinase/response regulator CckA
MNSDDHFWVLLIEDNDDDAVLIRRLLTSGQIMHIDVEVADRLSSALKHLEGMKYDVILSDLGLPDSCGLETFSKIHSACSDTPIIALTGLDDETVALEAMQRGAQDYIVKNHINSRNIVRIIRYAIERHKLLIRLENSLKEIKALRELLPMCAWCKKIRDDKGYWKKVETYITELTGTEFTHGICPACHSKLMERHSDSMSGEIPKIE